MNKIDKLMINVLNEIGIYQEHKIMFDALINTGFFVTTLCSYIALVIAWTL